jgi:endonuclease/exonuclease/phosphatase family metal-dependent hydrolase
MSKMHVKVISLNVRIDVPVDGLNQWIYRRQSIVDYVLVQNPDVCFFQEVNPLMYAFLKEHLQNYQSVYMGRDVDRLGEGCPIFFKKASFSKVSEHTFWLSHHPQTPGSMDPEEGFPRIATHVRVLTKEKNTVSFLNTHLAYRSKRNQDLNLKVLFDFVQSLPVGEPLILGGDFNMERQTIQPYKPRNLRFAGEGNIHKTYHEFQGGEGRIQIDHLLSTDVEEASFSIDQSMFQSRHLSDHYPVIGEFIVYANA